MQFLLAPNYYNEIRCSSYQWAFMFMTFVKLNLEIYLVLKLINQKLKDNAVYVNGRT